jgi:hypothetical protein
MSSRKKRADTLIAMIRNNDYDKLKDQLELVFARKIATKVQRREEEIITSLKANLNLNKRK